LAGRGGLEPPISAVTALNARQADSRLPALAPEHEVQNQQEDSDAQEIELALFCPRRLSDERDADNIDRGSPNPVRHSKADSVLMTNDWFRWQDHLLAAGRTTRPPDS
jgi:hypothetical protein